MTTIQTPNAGGPKGLIARFENRDTTTQLYEAEDIGKEMICLGPKVGV